MPRNHYSGACGEYKSVAPVNGVRPASIDKDVTPMKPASLSEGRRGPAQIWNNSPQLAKIPPIHPTALVPPGARVVVIAPHPGDEVLACGGLLQLLSSLDHPLQLISVTDGCASHPGSERWPVELLSVIRPQESAEALRRLELLVNSVAVQPKMRRPTKPTHGSVKRRLENKSRRAAIKAGRRSGDE